MKRSDIMYLKITNAGVSYNEKTILEEINLEIKEKSHIAVVGRNGVGKTTLLKALIDNNLFESGIGEEKFNIFKSGKFEIGYLNQINNINDNNTLLEEILGVYSNLIKLENRIKELEEKLEIGATSKEIEEYEEILEKYKVNGGYEYKKEYSSALTKFGFQKEEQDKLISEFSGGEKTKIAFLKLLLSKPELLLLDEPTNHLDIEAIIWLEDYLKKYPKALLVVSHDRAFINKIASTIIEIEYGKSEIYHGNYDYYKIEKEKRYEKSLKDYEFQKKEIDRLQRIADRFRYKPSKASMAMSKLKMIERMEKLSPPERENLKTFNIKWNIKESGRLVLKLDNLASGYNKILNTCSFELLKKDRLGIIGENGTGKSTILKTIMNIIPKLNGSYEFGNNVSIGYFDQEQKTLDEELTIYEDFKNKFPEMNDFEIRKSLASFLFSQDDLSKKIKVLSGGEKVRLELCEVIIKQPNFLVLDEPTNHLDILSKDRLEAILESFPGTILFVSHDRYFISKVATSLLVLKKGATKYYAYTYEEYLERVKEENIEEDIKKEKDIKIKPKNLKNNDKKEIKRLEIEINKKEQKLKSFKESLYNPEIYNDYEKVSKINDNINKLEQEILELMTKWEKLNI